MEFQLSRRTCLKQLAGTALAGGAAVLSPCAQGSFWNSGPPLPTEADKRSLNRIAQEFLDRFSAPGLSVAIARHGQMVYQQAFGVADTLSRETLTSAHRFRIASVTKPVTSACVFAMIDQRKLQLDQPVFGAGGVLGDDYGERLPEPIPGITIRHLLTHTAGGWEKGRGDPMFRDPAMSQRELIERTLHEVPLEFAPGMHFGYSNFGYCLLGRVLEKVSGHTYATVMQQQIFDRCGVAMSIAGNTRSQRAPGEVVYFGQNGEDPYDMNVARMDSHGGWIATPTDLVKFALHVDGFEDPPDILSADSIRAMTAPGGANPSYACGWAVNHVPNWWHIGSLPGVTTILVRTAGGFCWAAFTNTRTSGIDSEIDDMMWRMVKAVPAWKA